MRPSFALKSYLLAALLFLAGISNAATYYVDASSTVSTANGQQATPWKTLSQVQSAMSSFQPGDFILFKKGTTYTGSLNCSKSGTASAPITFGTYGTGAAPIFTSTSSGSNLFSFNSRQYIVIDGFTITDLTLDPNDRYQEAIIDIAFDIDNSSYITIKNCDISLVGAGVLMNGSNNTMDHNNIGNLRMIKNTPTSVNSDDDYGANPVIINGSYNNITSNNFHDCWAYSYDYQYDGGAIEFYGTANHYNKIMYNTATNSDGFMEVGASGGGSSDNNLVGYNKIINCNELIYINNSGQYATSVNNMQFFNNVIIHTVTQLTNPSSMIGMAASSSTANIINLKNNVFYLSTGIDVARSGKFTGSQLTHEDNIYRLGSGSVLNFTIGSTEMSTTAPIFTSTTATDPLQWNYIPVTASPAIDFGQNLGLTRDFAGNTVPSVPNAGILESAGASTLSASATAGTIACNGGTTTVTVTGTGGTTPYTGTGTFTVGAGTYSYTVTDGAGASTTTSITVTQPTIITSTVTPGTIAVFGGTTTVTVSAAGGTTAYTYKLNSGSYQSSNTFTGVAAGTHTVTVKDANGCTLAKTITITQPAAPDPLVAASAAGTISCNGGTTTVTVSATGGVTPYTGTGTFTVNAGTYTYNVSDASGATATTSITVTQPTAINVTVTPGTITVYGGTTSVSVSATGGTGAYTYRLNTGSYQSSNTFTGVAAGSHTITVKDANGCTRTNSFTLTQPAAPAQLIASSSAGTISCNGGTTTVTVSATGGVNPYTGTGTFTVSAGTYNYTVTDAAGTTATTSITVTQPTAIAATIAAGTIATYGGTTDVTVNATGGTGGYTYKLNSGSYQSSNTFTGVAAGNHSATVKDGNGCTSVKSFTLTQPSAPDPLTASSAAGTILCNGGTTTVVVSATGGTAPYTGTGSFIVSAGTYSYTVTDASGATASTAITVTQPTAIVATVSTGTIAVFGGTTTATVTATGGTAPYTYQVDGGSFQSSNIFATVAAGNHTITVKDANGCTTVATFTLTQPAANTMVVTATATPILCNNAISTITVGCTGGTAPYTGTGYFTGYAGTYTYTVTDATGATASTTITITQPAAIAISVTAGSITTAGGTATATASATGGTAPYTYMISGTTAFQASNSFPGLIAGSYSITVKDVKGCTASSSFTVTSIVSTSLRISLVSKSNATCRGSATGSIQVIATGGRAPYLYQLNSGRFTSSPLFKNLRAGIYRVTAKDANGNLVSMIVFIFDGRRTCSSGTSAGLDGKIKVTAYPNPTTDRFSLAIESETESEVTVEVMNLNGTRVYMGKGSVYKNFVFGENFQSGTYIVRVTQGNNVQTTKLVKAK